jgi:hypothetical protein
MSARADRYRQEAAKAKQNAAEAKNAALKRAFDEMASRWLRLAEEMEQIERKRSRRTRAEGASH